MRLLDEQMKNFLNDYGYKAIYTTYKSYTENESDTIKALLESMLATWCISFDDFMDEMERETYTYKEIWYCVDDLWFTSVEDAKEECPDATIGTINIKDHVQVYFKDWVSDETNIKITL